MKIYNEVEDEKRKLKKCMEVDKTTVGGWELKRRLVSSGKFYPSDATMMLEEMVSKGELKEVSYDTYIQGSDKNDWTMLKEKIPL